MSSDPFDLIGHIVGGQFRVDAVAGDTDLSVVYEGRRLDTNTAVAIKCLNLPETLPDSLARALDAAFQQAFRVHDRLARGQENIAKTFTSGEIRSPRTGAVVPYMVREWLEGESLAGELARRQKEARSNRPIDEVIGLLTGAFEAIAFAHEQGEVHLGLNPGNLFAAKGADGTITLKVLDFGLARMMNDFAPESPAESHSGSGLRLLLPGYAAPEQIDESLGPAGPRTDVYALALITMEALAGQKLPQFLEEVLNRALSAAPQARQASAGELWRQVSSGVVLRAPVAGARDPAPEAVALSKLPRKPNPLFKKTLPMSFEPRPPSSTYGPVAVPTAPEVPDPATPAPLGVLFSTSAPAGELAGDPNDLVKPDEVPSLFPPVLAAGADPAAGRPPRAPLASLRSRKGIVMGAAAAVIVVGIGVVSVRRAHRASASVASAKTEPTPTPSDTPVPAPLPLASSSSSVEATPSATQPDAASAVVIAARFGPAAAKRALDSTKHDVGKCRHGRAWGYASAKVTFANDGSVDKVTVMPPLAGTQTGVCAAEALAGVRVPPFAGNPGQVSYRLFVAPK